MASRKRSQLVPDSVPRQHSSTKEHLRRLSDRVNQLLAWAMPTWGVPLDEPFDLIPTEDDQWVGNQDAAVGGIVVGKTRTVPEGAFAANPGMVGPIVAGIRGAGLTQSDLDKPNAPVGIYSTGFHMLGGPASWLEMPFAITSDRYLLAGRSFLADSGEIITPLILGPAITYAASDFGAITTDTQLTGSFQNISQIVLANNYAVGDIYSYALLLSEEANLPTQFDLQLVQVLQPRHTWSVNLNGHAQVIAGSFPIQQAWTAGQQMTIQARATVIGSGTLNAWVRGATQAGGQQMAA